MGRSVSVPSGAIAVAYASFSVEDAFDASWEFDACVEGLRQSLVERYPSFRNCERSLGREDRAVAENGHCYVCVSEYCGLVAISVVPKDGPLAEAGAAKINVQQFAGCFGDPLVSVGRFSNGEQIFNAASGKNKGAMGLGFSSKEGWL